MVRSHEHRSRWAESAHRNALSENNLHKPSRVSLQYLIEGFGVLDARYRVRLVMIHIAGSDNQRRRIHSPNGARNGGAEILQFLPISGSDGDRRQPDAVGNKMLKKGKLDFQGVLHLMRFHVVFE